MNRIQFITQSMNEYARTTGIMESGESTRRYLWTDAFALCNFLTLFRRTGEEKWLQYAFFLVELVHNILGRHRIDSSKDGWISGLNEEDGRSHPTKGGLRIGKKINERGPDEPYDPQAEWDRDGQYYHYLVKWMLALNLLSRHTKNPDFNIWANELAKSAHAAFVYTLPNGIKRMYWKMSIDLSYPLVTSMGKYDPLDGLITYRIIQKTGVESFGMTGAELENEIGEMETMCETTNWVTGDPLATGGIMVNACHLFQLMSKKSSLETGLLNSLLISSYEGVRIFIESGALNQPAGYRLAFRELGLAIGLHGIGKIRKLITEKPGIFPDRQTTGGILNKLEQYTGISSLIAEFWLASENRTPPAWTDHMDINNVMLATSIAPDSYLVL